MIDWVEGAGKMWGGVKRRIAAGGYWRDDLAFHVDGHASRSHIAKLWEEREGAAQASRPVQRFAEVFRGEALSFEAAITDVRELWFYMAHVRYVIPASRLAAKSKMLILREAFPKILRTQDAYYDELHALHCYLSGRMDAHQAKLRAASAVED